MPDDDGADGTLLFELTAHTVSTLAAGTHALEARTVGLVTSLGVDLLDVPTDRDVIRNEVAVVSGAGIVTATEGTITARSGRSRSTPGSPRPRSTCRCPWRRSSAATASAAWSCSRPPSAA